MWRNHNNNSNDGERSVLRFSVIVHYFGFFVLKNGSVALIPVIATFYLGYGSTDLAEFLFWYRVFSLWSGVQPWWHVGEHLLTFSNLCGHVTDLLGGRLHFLFLILDILYFCTVFMSIWSLFRSSWIQFMPKWILFELDWSIFGISR